MSAKGEQRKKSRPRRGRGEGTIWERPDGTWCAQVSQGFDTKHKRLRRTISRATKQALLEELARLRVKQSEGTLPEPSSMTVEQHLAQWLKGSGGQSVAGATAAAYGRNIRRHINAHIGTIRLQKLSPLHVQHMLSSMRCQAGGKPSARLSCNVLAILSRALDQAVRWGLMLRNPCAAVDRPQLVHFEIRPLDQKQANAFLKVAGRDEFAAFWILALQSGARLGELLALKWADVDLVKRVLSIRRTQTIVGKETQIKEPKTKAGRRQITLPDRAVVALVKHRRDGVAAGHAGNEWVFCDPKGKPIDRQRIQARFKKLLKLAKLPEVRFHDLRHTHATLLLLAGVHPKVVQERLGHATIGITLDTYSHVLPSLQTDASSQLDRLFG